uniref:Drosophila retrotransposon 1731 5' long terminal repeat (LTR) n=1 Tax=Drosophila melanogaster TaxID=7227 RepID=V9H1E5_DROME|nr:unnamed protein product [Drosophila melanogaster]
MKVAFLCVSVSVSNKTSSCSDTRLKTFYFAFTLSAFALNSLSLGED